MLSLQQKLSQQQKLSPQQIQHQKMLQLNTIALEQRIKTELEINPVLEETLEDIEEIEIEQIEERLEQEQPEEKSDDADVLDEYDNTEDEFEPEDYMNEGDIDESNINYSADDEEDNRPIAPAKSTLAERLLEQLYMLPISEEETICGEEIIQNLSNDGYLKENLEKIVSNLNMFEHVDITIEQAENILKEIQHFDPPGIASRNLQECLLIQLRSSSFDPYYTYLAEQILTDYFNDFINKKFDKVQKELKLTKDTLKSVIEIIHRLDPKPGEGDVELEELNQITPDFIIEKVDNNYIVTLNDKSLPSVTISETYLQMIEQNKRKRKISRQEKETHKFLREKFESAKWFIASIQQRRKTLLSIMQTIFEKQFKFFEEGPRALRPMIYKDIADEIGMDISTISRVVNGKYVQSQQGIHELKYFFSEGLSTDSGQEISNKHIKELIKEICDNEKKKSPYSDDKIAKILKEKGIHIARRTVAKYREQMNIPVARLRKDI